MTSLHAHSTILWNHIRPQPTCFFFSQTWTIAVPCRKQEQSIPPLSKCLLAIAFTHYQCKTNLCSGYPMIASNAQILLFVLSSLVVQCCATTPSAANDIKLLPSDTVFNYSLSCRGAFFCRFLYEPYSAAKIRLVSNMKYIDEKYLFALLAQLQCSLAILFLELSGMKHPHECLLDCSWLFSGLLLTTSPLIFERWLNALQLPKIGI